MARVSIEDCLNYMENRFALVTVASDRARKLMKGANPLIQSKNKEAVIALREIADGHIEARDPMIVQPVTKDVVAEAPAVEISVEAPTEVAVAPAEENGES